MSGASTDPAATVSCMVDEPTFADFEALDLRVGTITRAELNAAARNPAYKLWIDLGDGEPAQSSAKITELYEVQELVGRQVVVVAGSAPMYSSSVP